MGEPDKDKLQSELEEAGWSVERHTGSRWWEHECWLLLSRWRPVGAAAFITFLIDPQSEAKGVATVWALSISAEKHADPMGSGTTVGVSPNWPERLKEIVAATNALRP